ncbi:ferredoxin--nitrite reductase [Prochlorococcus sp. MIT 1300]|uniref:ferredoxin--nitrite reductase n=1 Tax=Prochlorococcus sp. MIT 1300 TaxID=3096218 RepID=UPI002A760059|nr:ferredoxin--nitrite reductase [Prochlorococcus sp. MIT 1300]
MTEEFTLKPYLQGKKLNKIEQMKSIKDGLEIGKDIDKFSKIGWQEMDKTDLELRLKWYGMFWRPKSPGQFMLRLRIPNGIINSTQLNIVASIVARYGENGSCDITTRQNLQLRGVLISDLPEIIKRLNEAGISTIQSGFDNPRNVTGNPLAGVDPEEIIDTRPYTIELQNYLTNNGKGNSDFSNLPRKWNTAIAGSQDNFLLHNDLIFHPVKHQGELGFGVWVGGVLSAQLNVYAVPLNVWIKANQICKLTGAILGLWRDNGERDKRPKGRFRFYLDSIGIDVFRKLLENRFGPLIEDPGSEFSKDTRSLFGIHPQKQAGEFYAGIHVPVGRLTAEDLQDLSTVAYEYGSSEIRLTEDQNIIFIGIQKASLEKFKENHLLKRFPLAPQAIAAGTVSCTGNTYCSFALTNTKDVAFKVSSQLDKELELPKEVKIHWTGCPNSCGQAYMGGIGLTGTKAKNKQGQMVEAYQVTVGGSQGKIKNIGTVQHKSVPKDEVKAVIKQILISDFGASPKKTNKKRIRNLVSTVLNYLFQKDKSCYIQ